MFVHSRMHTNLSVVGPDTTVREALSLLADSPAGALPFIAGGTLKGLVTTRQLEEKITELLMAGLISDFDDVVLPMVESKLVTLAPDALIEEAACLLAKHKLYALPVVDSDDTLVGVITERDVLKSFGQMLGLGETGSRLTIRVEDKPGRLMEIAMAMMKYEVSIISVAAFAHSEGYRDLVLRINTDNPMDIVADLRAKGFKVVHVCQSTAQSL